MVEASGKESRRSDLYERQQNLHARFGLVSGWEMALSYGDPSSEHLGVRATTGLIDLSHCGSVRVWGSEAMPFLNGLVTNDVKTLAPGKGMRAAFLTGHGKVKALCRVFNLGDAYLVINDPQTHDKVLKYLFPFSYAGDFKVEDVSDRYRLLSVQGPKAHLIMKEICFEPVPELSEHAWFKTLIAGHQTFVARTSHTGEHGFDIFVPAPALNDVWDFILLKGEFHSIVPFGLDALDSLRIEAGIPVYGVDIDESNMMLETGLQDAVSLNKGCYTGQEAVAMATYRGHVSKKLSGLKVKGDVVPNHGDVIQKDGKEIGFVTSALQSSTVGSVITLAYLKYGTFDPGNFYEIRSESANLPAEVVELPFYRAS
ncbi:MAG: aminomethyltransferase family protein [Blastocatellia bacterium]